ncbi:gamma-glutamyl-gamma-aminobutyrate hydrolase family protein [Microbacterium sp.]|uniref:gamma-glutamyl-gamma-aminobutyrate hydrolase family protein n=1 Tax=Microbacterium sp. TaxID=51671 RepID=UPI0039E41595
MTVVMSSSSATPRHDADFARRLRALADIAGAAVEAAGLRPRWVNAADPDAAADDLVAQARGVIVLGGADIDPGVYVAAPAGALMDAADAAADAFEIALLRDALGRGIPVLTICRGTQLLNVALGGTLVQDLGEGIHRATASPMVTHDVLVREDTRLAGIVGAGVHAIRSGHHQAVDRLGDGLVVSAVAPDGIVEAVELPGDAWVVGVQWHPEDAAADPAVLRSLVEDFARAAR